MPRPDAARLVGLAKHRILVDLPTPRQLLVESKGAATCGLFLPDTV